ncbi:hypothetical protein BV25DRAFT_269659 [Artomyces pyxidatus]|uniref:Uncharacterized protein n=1 Tax=Artomyces pyxidatus TaxID=48021 RepID=A0ACB8T8W5_9AGAM|nr:hypothetical protein BV25DRAFT_269659 [Artomyces pyxidatus]
MTGQIKDATGDGRLVAATVSRGEGVLHLLYKSLARSIRPQSFRCTIARVLLGGGHSGRVSAAVDGAAGASRNIQSGINNVLIADAKVMAQRKKGRLTYIASPRAVGGSNGLPEHDEISGGRRYLKRRGGTRMGRIHNMRRRCTVARLILICAQMLSTDAKLTIMIGWRLAG